MAVSMDLRRGRLEVMLLLRMLAASMMGGSDDNLVKYFEKETKRKEKSLHEFLNGNRKYRGN
jgi:hypothetical protein